MVLACKKVKAFYDSFSLLALEQEYGVKMEDLKELIDLALRGQCGIRKIAGKKYIYKTDWYFTKMIDNVHFPIGLFK